MVNLNPSSRELPARCKAWPGLLLAVVSVVLAGCISGGNPPVRQAQYHIPTEQVREYYVMLEQKLTGGGLLKTNEGADAGFSARNLVTNFERIALYDEFQIRNRKLVRARKETRIRRWEEPIRVSVNFGESFPEELQIADSMFILDYLKRLERLTGREIDVSQGQANFHIFVLNSEELSGIGAHLAKLSVPGDQLIGAQIANHPVESLCSVFAVTDSRQDSRYLTAIVVVKAEHPDLLRRACYHEEIAQGLGLTNDSIEARPSIFNDNEEYAYLTFHDELLLRMLYDPRISSGMTRGQAMPVAEIVAHELRPELDG